MRIDPEDFRRHYAMLSDQALFALNRTDLIEVARACYDEEVARRKSARLQEEQSAQDSDDAPTSLDDQVEFDDEFDIDTEPAPDWLDDAACACAFSVNPGASNPPDLAKARAALRAAGIPCHITMEQIEAPQDAPRTRSEYCVMVPGALNLHATSVLDRDLFNPDQEANWRAHLDALSDEELRKLSPDVFCAGLLDRAARLKKAYQDEVARRKR
jgi:hypothetical protein